MITPQLLQAELDENNRPLQQEQVVPIAMKCIGGLQKFRIPFKNLSEHDFEVDFYFLQASSAVSLPALKRARSSQTTQSSSEEQSSLD